MATNFGVKIGEIGLLAYIHRLDIPKRSGISQFRFHSLAIIFLYVVCKYGEIWFITPEFKRGKGVGLGYIPSSINSL